MIEGLCVNWCTKEKSRCHGRKEAEGRGGISHFGGQGEILLWVPPLDFYHFNVFLLSLTKTLILIIADGSPLEALKNIKKTPKLN